MISEGISREFINRIQNLRKEKEYNLTDRISITLEESCPFKTNILDHTEHISSEVLSDKIEFVNSLSIFEEIEIDDILFKVNVNKINY